MREGCWLWREDNANNSYADDCAGSGETNRKTQSMKIFDTILWIQRINRRRRLDWLHSLSVGRLEVAITIDFADLLIDLVFGMHILGRQLAVFGSRHRFLLPSNVPQNLSYHNSAFSVYVSQYFKIRSSLGRKKKDDNTKDFCTLRT